jgi:hypothetical protein
MNIYDLDQEIDDALTASDGEITPEIEAMLEDQERLSRWIENATKKYFNVSALSVAVKSEIDRLQALKSAYDRTAESLKNSLTRLVGENNKRDLGFAQIGWRKSESVMIAEGKEEFLPDCYLVPKWIPNKTQIKQDLKMGASIEHCELVTKNNIQIK